MAGSGTKAVFLAVIGNGFLTLIKFAAFMLSGSGAMLSEAIHSLADTGNQALLFIGIRRSERPADRLFHYGYGQERFLFALLSAVGIFVLGCGVTVYHGIHTLLHPPELTINWIIFAVLGISFVVDGAVFWMALKSVKETKGKQSFASYLKSTSDPTILAVLFEDFVACLGVLVAATGILLCHWTGNSVYDGISSIIIGVLLGAVAIWLGYRNRTLILGPAIPKDVEDQIVRILTARPSVDSVRELKTRVVGADQFRLKAEIDYNGPFLAQQHAAWVKEQVPLLKTDAEIESFVDRFGDRVIDALALEVDSIEEEMQRKFPNLQFIDLESDLHE